MQMSRLLSEYWISYSVVDDDFYGVYDVGDGGKLKESVGIVFYAIDNPFALKFCSRIASEVLETTLATMTMPWFSAKEGSARLLHVPMAPYAPKYPRVRSQNLRT